MLRKKSRIANFGDENYSLTQPNLAMSIGKIVNRLQSGQSIPQTEMPVYLGDQLPEMIGFENLTKLEQIDFAREFRQKAQSTFDAAEKSVKENNAKQAAENAAQAILQKQIETAKQL